MNEYYGSNIKPILQKGKLVYVCKSYTNLLPLFMIQKKNILLIFSKVEMKAFYQFLTKKIDNNNSPRAACSCTPETYLSINSKITF